MYQEDFSFIRDFKHITWGATLWLNFLRAFFAGGLIIFFMVITGGLPITQVLMLLLIFPFIYLFCLLPVGLITALLSSWGVPFIWLVTFVTSLIVALFGDPFVYILHKVTPSIIPVKKFSFMNFTLLIFVIEEKSLL